MKIVWREDYDLHSDKLYKSPCCEDCSKTHGAVPVALLEDGTCQCINCHQIGIPDKKQLRWLQERQGEKVVEHEKCFQCGQYTMTTHYHKNAVTKKWQAGWGECTNPDCKCHFIV